MEAEKIFFENYQNHLAEKEKGCLSMISVKEWEEGLSVQKEGEVFFSDFWKQDKHCLHRQCSLVELES